MTEYTRQDRFMEWMHQIIESRLRWFGHVWRRSVEVSISRSDRGIIRGREKPRKL